MSGFYYFQPTEEPKAVSTSTPARTAISDGTLRRLSSFHRDLVIPLTAGWAGICHLHRHRTLAFTVGYRTLLRQWVWYSLFVLSVSNGDKGVRSIKRKKDCNPCSRWRIVKKRSILESASIIWCRIYHSNITFCHHNLAKAIESFCWRWAVDIAWITLTQQFFARRSSKNRLDRFSLMITIGFSRTYLS